jgi:2-polyprenyl-3-methyl-5-hydroxy-6-metoxy-1,4-benzoquinol methylase
MSQPVRNLSEADSSKIDIPSLMAEIRERIKADVERNRDARQGISPLAAKFADARGVKYGDLQLAENLRYLNLNYAFETRLSPDSVVTHRQGFLGKLIVRFKRKVISFLREGVFADYLNSERIFVEHLVRHLNETGRYIDARDDRLVRDLERLVQRVDDEKVCSIVALQRQMNEMALSFEQRLAVVDAMVRGLEGILNNYPQYMKAEPVRAEEMARDEEAPSPELSYLLLENRYRGSEGEIEQRQKIYPQIFRGTKGSILEIGSGRGELQRLFAASGLESYGVDLDVVMVNVANSNGCKTLYGDGIAHLRSLEDSSLGGLVAIQVVEHLTRQQLQELFELAKRKVRAGGRIAFETINPQSLLALSSNYFRDPTHVWPMHPDTLGYMATLAGLKIIETKMLSPVSPNHLLKDIPIDSSHTPAVGDAVARINENFRQLNRLLYGFQDYCLVLEA